MSRSFKGVVVPEEYYELLKHFNMRWNSYRGCFVQNRGVVLMFVFPNFDVIEFRDYSENKKA